MKSFLHSNTLIFFFVLFIHGCSSDNILNEPLKLSLIVVGIIIGIYIFVVILSFVNSLPIILSYILLFIINIVFIFLLLIIGISIYYLIIYQLFWLHTTGVYSFFGIIIGFILSSYLIFLIVDSKQFNFILDKINNLKLEEKAEDTGTLLTNINRIFKKLKK